LLATITTVPLLPIDAEWMLVRMDLWLCFALTYGCGFIGCNCFQAFNEKFICI